MEFSLARQTSGFGKPTEHGLSSSIKLGRTDVGAAAAASHTATLAGSDRIYDAVLKQYGAHRVDNLEEFIDLACVTDIKLDLTTYNEMGYDFLTVPLVHPRYGAAASRLRGRRMFALTLAPQRGRSCTPPTGATP